MSPNTRKRLLLVGLPSLACVGLAALLGGLLRPSPQAPSAPPALPAVALSAEVATAPPPASAVVAPTPAVSPDTLVVVQEPNEQIHYEPLPPLPPGTTTEDLADMYTEDLCACEDMACAQAARIKHNRYFGQAIPAHVPRNRERSARMNDCIQHLIAEEGG